MRTLRLSAYFLCPMSVLIPQSACRVFIYVVQTGYRSKTLDLASWLKSIPKPTAEHRPSQRRSAAVLEQQCMGRLLSNNQKGPDSRQPCRAMESPLWTAATHWLCVMHLLRLLDERTCREVLTRSREGVQGLQRVHLQAVKQCNGATHRR